MTPVEHWGTSQVSRNTTAGSMARRNGSVTSVPRNTPFIPIGRPMPRSAGLGSTSATVAPFSPGTSLISLSFWEE
ncbi:hypothetical protein AHAS_Ahas13G0036300 [Arachis hypogaea]